MESAPEKSQTALEWVLSNKLKAIFYTWGAGITGSLAYQWTRPTPVSIKIIHTRVYAQAITLAALGSVAALEMYAQATKEAEEKEHHLA